MINTKSMMKNTLKELLSEFKKFKIQRYQSKTIRKEINVKSSI